MVESCLRSETAGGELVKETSQGFELFLVPIAQYIELECPKLQVAGGSPAGDAIFDAGVVQQFRTRLCQG